MARQFFVGTTYPQLGNCVGCHSPDSVGPQKRFLDHDPDAAYALVEGTLGLIAEPSSSDFLHHTHSDPMIDFTTSQRRSVESWLMKEVNARGLPGARPRPATPDEAYAAIAKCMEFAVWDGYRVGDLGYAVTNTDGACRGCHSLGQGGFYMSADSYASFDKARTYPYIQKFFVAQLDATGCFDKLVPARRLANKILENNDCDPRTQHCHPLFSLGVADPDGFAQATLDNYENSDCQSGYAALDDAGLGDAGADADAGHAKGGR
jgi:hypothetical protein